MKARAIFLQFAFFVCNAFNCFAILGMCGVWFVFDLSGHMCLVISHCSSSSMLVFGRGSCSLRWGVRRFLVVPTQRVGLLACLYGLWVCVALVRFQNLLWTWQLFLYAVGHFLG